MSKDWVEQYESKLDYPAAMARLVAMHRLIGEKRRAAAASNYKLKVFLLIASAATMGALWVLLGGTFPQPMKWIGAILSTVVTGVNAFQLTLGPGKVVEQLDELYSEFGRSLAHAREHPTKSAGTTSNILRVPFSETACLTRRLSKWRPRASPA